MVVKILYVITKSNFGGAQRYVYNLAVAAQDAGHDVAVVVGGDGVLVEQLHKASVRVISLPMQQQNTFLFDLLTFGSLFTLVRIFRHERPAVVHANSAKAGGLGVFAARLCGVPRILFTAHGWEFNAPRAHISKIGIRFFSWLTILLSHKTICVSNAVRRDVLRMPWARRKLSVIHNGVFCETLLPRNDARNALDSESTAPVWIGMLSELHPTKRIEDAIRAFGLLSKRYPGVELCIIGEGSERERLACLIRDMRLEKRVRLAGFIKDAPRYFSAFDLFLHASQSEAFALALLEAGCAELPIIATCVGGIPEMIENERTGILVPPHNPEKMANAIETLLTDPEKARVFAALFAKRVHADFTNKRMVNQTLALYTS